MSHIELQTQLTRFLRQPELEKQVLEKLEATSGLSRQEFVLLRTLASDPLVVKYGEHLRRLRREDAFKSLPVSLGFFGFEVLSKLYIESFEPLAAKVRRDDLALAFVDFLAGERGAAARRNLEPWARSVFQYEAARIRVSRMRILPLRHHPILIHRSFVIVELSYNVPALLQAKEIKRNACRHASPTNLLFLRTRSRTHVELCEIDQTLKKFLSDILQRRPERSEEAKPDAYNDLVTLGLCRAE